MLPLRIIVTTADAERLRGALVIASAQAALGGAAAVFLQLDAVGLLRLPVGAREDDRHQAAGLPSLAMLIDEALALGVAILACQSGLALAHLTIADLPGGVDAGGVVGFLERTDADARLLIA